MQGVCGLVVVEGSGMKPVHSQSAHCEEKIKRIERGREGGPGTQLRLSLASFASLSTLPSVP